MVAVVEPSVKRGPADAALAPGRPVHRHVVGGVVHAELVQIVTFDENLRNGRVSTPRAWRHARGRFETPAYQNGAVSKRAAGVLPRRRLDTRRPRLSTRAWQHARGPFYNAAVGRRVGTRAFQNAAPACWAAAYQYGRHGRRVRRFKTGRAF